MPGTAHKAIVVRVGSSRHMMKNMKARFVIEVSSGTQTSKINSRTHWLSVVTRLTRSPAALPV